MTAPPHPRYRDTLCLYFEEEVMGEAYFRRLAGRFADPLHARKLRLLAAVEHHAAEAVRPLLARHGLVPRPQEALQALGAAEADAEDSDWDALLGAMRESYPGYVEDFRRLEAMAPAADLAPLRFLTGHEVAAIAFLEREAARDPASTRPLERYLAETPPVPA